MHALFLTAGGERFSGRAGHGGLAVGQYVGRVSAQRRQQHAGAGQEDARVPQHLALQQQRLGGVGLGLFDEAGHRAAAIGPRRTLLDVAIGGAGEAGQHAEGDDGARFGGAHALPHHGGKGGGVGDVVVGRAEQQQRVGRIGCARAGTDMQGGQRHGGGGVAASGFEQQLAAQACGLQVVGHQKAVVFGGHAQQRRLGKGQALGREPQQALVADERHELLGVALAAERPQARARAAAEDDGDDGLGSGHHGCAFTYSALRFWARRRHTL